MTRKILFGFAALILASLACSTLTRSTNRVVGSGHVVSEPRTVGSFTSVALAGSADVNILLGDKESVNVEADDNILPLIETTVKDDTLVIGTKPLTNIAPSSHVVVTVVVKSLKGTTLSGSGNMNIGAMSGTDLLINLPGSGDITAEGAVDHLTVNLLGSGHVDCHQLKARSANVTLTGSGDINVNATESLNASIVGSGNIRYEGNPAQVKKSITGSGTITP